MCKLTEPFTEEQYLGHSDVLAAYTNTILKYNPHLRKLDTVKLLTELNRGSPEEVLKTNRKRVQGPIITKITPELVKEYSDRFSITVIFKSKPTLKFLAENPDHLKALLESGAYWHSPLEEFIDKMLENLNNLQHEYIASYIKTITADKVLEEKLKHIMSRQGYNDDALYYIEGNTREELKEILVLVDDYNLLDNLTRLNDEGKTKIKNVFELIREDVKKGKNYNWTTPFAKLLFKSKSIEDIANGMVVNKKEKEE